MALHEVLDAIDQLPLKEQQQVLKVLDRKVAARKRNRLIKQIEKNREELRQGLLRPKSVEEIMREATS